MSLIYTNKRGLVTDQRAAEVDDDELKELLSKALREKPAVYEIVADNGNQLLCGIGDGIGLIQFTNASREPPYMITVNTSVKDGDNTDYICDMDGQTSEFDRHNCVAGALIQEIVLHFQRTGKRLSGSFWKET